MNWYKKASLPSLPEDMEQWVSYLEFNEERNRNPLSDFIVYIKENPDEYENESFPDNLKYDERILSTRKAGWIDILSVDPKFYEEGRYNTDFPADLKNDPDIIKARNEGWMRRLSTSPIYCEGEFPPELVNANTKYLRIKGWQKSISGNPYTYDTTSFPADLKNDPDIIRSRIIKWQSILIKNPEKYDKEDFPFDLKQSSEILKVRKEAWLNLVYQHPIIYWEKEFIPKDLKDDHETIDNVADGLISGLKERGPYDFYDFYLMGQKNTDARKVFKIVMQKLIEQTKRNSNDFRHIYYQIMSKPRGYYGLAEQGMINFFKQIAQIIKLPLARPEKFIGHQP